MCLITSGFTYKNNETSFFFFFLNKIGIAASFAVKLFKAWMAEKDANSVTSSLRKANLDKRLLVSSAWTKGRHTSLFSHGASSVCPVARSPQAWACVQGSVVPLISTLWQMGADSSLTSPLSTG